MAEKESFGGELSKQIPVKEIYEDMAHPTLSTMGKTLQGVGIVYIIECVLFQYRQCSAFSPSANSDQGKRGSTSALRSLVLSCLRRARTTI